MNTFKRNFLHDDPEKGEMMCVLGLLIFIMQYLNNHYCCYAYIFDNHFNLSLSLPLYPLSLD